MEEKRVYTKVIIEKDAKIKHKIKEIYDLVFKQKQEIKSCNNCPFKEGTKYDYRCKLNGIACDIEKRPKKCPLRKTSICSKLD